ncbi:Type II secretion system protein E [compost metagenome]
MRVDVMTAATMMDEELESKELYLPSIAFCKLMGDQGKDCLIFSDMTAAVHSNWTVEHPGIIDDINNHLESLDRPGILDYGCLHTDKIKELLLRASANNETAELEQFEKKEAKKNLLRLAEVALGMQATDIHIDASPGMPGDIYFRVNTKVSKARPIKMSYLEIITMLSRAYNWEGSQNSTHDFDLTNIASTTLTLDVNVKKNNGIVREQVRLRMEKGPSQGRDAIKCVIRVTPTKKHRNLDDLGVNPGLRKVLVDECRKPKGIIVVSGPTGSGKTTLLHGMLHHIDDDVVVEAVEDPVEIIASYNSLITQNNLDPNVGYVGMLRSMMRKDPDIIVIGEMRDPEVVGFAFNTALTGHLVMTTFHTNNSIGIIARMADMGLSFNDLSMPDILSVLIATRLAPQLCSHCSKPLSQHDTPVLYRKLAESTKTAPYLDSIRTINNSGCNDCRNGISGVKSINEVIVVDKQIRKLIRDKDMDGIQVYLKSHGWKSLEDLALDLVARGEMDPEDADSIFSGIFRDTEIEYNYKELYEGF